MSSESHSLNETGWARFAASYRVGDVVDGTVVRVAPFGSFIRTDDGVDGLAPIVDWPTAPEQGTRARGRIAAIDEVNRRFSLLPV